jgi:hypothetical protein
MARNAPSDRSQLLAKLRSRRPELEAEALARVYGVSDPKDVSDPEYIHGLRTAVLAALEYGFAAVELGGRSVPSMPVSLRAQARLAARNAVGLDIVLRRYFAGYALVSDLLIEEAGKDGVLRKKELKLLLQTQWALFDRVIAAVSDEYKRECEDQLEPVGERILHIKRLLAGELLESAELAYDLDTCHIALVAAGPGATDAVKALAKRSGGRLLLVHPNHERVWAWLGIRHGSENPDISARLSSAPLPIKVSLAAGEAAQGISGWRLSHRQAIAALPIALRKPGTIVCYSEVAMLASLLQDDLLATSLHERYLVPLNAERDGGEVARETLRAYFSANRNASSAAAALGVNRRTIANRLQAIEELFGRPLNTFAAEMEAALHLQDSTFI